MIAPSFDVYLGDKGALQGYRCRQLQRDSAPQIAPRFSTGSQGETDLDLLKSESIDNLEGGMFERKWIDPQRVTRAVGVYNAFDQNVYPAPPPVVESLTGVDTSYYPDVKAESENYSFIAQRYYSAGDWYNKVVMIDKSGTMTNLTLPAGIAGGAIAPITSLHLHKGYLYMCGQTTTTFTPIYRYNIDANTFQDLGGSGGTMFFCSTRGNLYALNRLSQIYSCTNETAASAATFTYLTDVGFKDYAALPNSEADFNGAIWIAKDDGIYRFDGVTAVKVLKLVTKQLKEFNGALYFIAGNWLYRFDGTNLLKIHFFGLLENVPRASLSSNSDFLFIQTSTQGSAWTQDDKLNATTSAVTRVYTYDGAAFMLLNESTKTLTSYAQLLLYVGNRLYDFLSTSSFGVWTVTCQSYNLTANFNYLYTTSGSQLEITTGEHDDNFPNIFKALEFLELRYSGMISGDSIAIKYQTFDGKTWAAPVTFATLTSTSDNRLEITDSTKKLYKRLKINIVITFASASTLKFAGLSIRYTLQPRVRWRWQALLMAEGNSMVTDRNGEAITSNANSLANTVEKSIKQKTPAYFLAPDYALVHTGVNSSAVSIIVNGEIPLYTDPYAEYPMVAILNNSSVWEILQVSAVSYDSNNDRTTLTIVARGYLGITNAAIDAGKAVRLCYKVYVNRLLSESPNLSEETYQQQIDTGESQLQREYMLELIEV